MQKRKLGNLEVSAIGLGCNVQSLTTDTTPVLKINSV
jgi:aryl-alcohol dehydrogenase-like predicted oxidoreductase